MWGNPAQGRRGFVVGRAIPTGVGKSDGESCAGSPSPGHPHGCGEISCERVCLVNYFGPSPRVWGNRSRGSRQRTPHRVIPTGVGKSHRRGVLLRQCAGHPHGCGEINLVEHTEETTDGPSPRVWGNRMEDAIYRANARAIPTGVGKSHGVSRRGEGRAGHPHGCGEIPHWGVRRFGSPGPSPRVWGNLSVSRI